MIYYVGGVFMKDLSSVKDELRDLQTNFNPEKSTYKIIDSVINDSMSVDNMIKYLYSIKGIEKYPEDIKNKYFGIIDDLQLILVSVREKEDKKEQEKKTKELQDIIASLEERNVGKREDKNSVKEEDVSDDNKEDKPLNDVFKKEKVSESLKNNIANIKEKSLDRARDVIASQVGDDSLLDSKGRKLCIFLIIMIAICILVGVLLVIFL